mgnify:CR=1 FL=1
MADEAIPSEDEEILLFKNLVTEDGETNFAFEPGILVSGVDGETFAVIAVALFED